MGTWDDSRDLVRKRAGSPAEDLRGEAAGLAWLGQAEAGGGMRAAEVTSFSATELCERRVRTTWPSREAARSAGAALARTHAAGAGWLGCPPPGWEGAAEEGASYVVHGAATPVIPREKAPASWGAFFAEWRLVPHVRTLVDSGLLAFDETAPLRRVCDRLVMGRFDAPQPALVEGAIARGEAACARLHGDLWAGNLLWDHDHTNPSRAVLIDPMAHGGHAGTDLAMLQLFGCDRLDDLLGAYDETSALADGWEERVGLHQLSPLLLHCVIYGGGFLGETLRVARCYA